MVENKEKYSIWVIPPEPLYGQLKDTIEKLSREFGSPTFEPHMTLLGNINQNDEDIEVKIKEMANITNKFELSLGSISFSTTYFQSVFVRINSTTELMELNLKAKGLFNMENNVFMPHISLLYGIDDMKIRETVASKINLPNSSFIVDELIVTPATDNPDEWQHSLKVPLK